MHRIARSIDVQIITIPTSDRAFAEIANRLVAAAQAQRPGDLEARLRRTFPRAIVRARDISGEAPAWYVYRDGGWRSPDTGPWWDASALPRIAVTTEGWIAEASATALGLLGIEAGDLATRHFTDFVVPGTLADSVQVFDIVRQGGTLTATILLRPSSGHVIAADLHAWRDGDLLIGVFRLATDVALPTLTPAPERPEVICQPETDAAFSGYVDRALARMPEVTPDGLALRLRRLYPHAEVSSAGGQWIARREPEGDDGAAGSWWTDPALSAVRYDAQGLIVEANSAAEALLGRSMVGHYWQEFVTPGSTEEVSAMLAILAERGRAESRFRMPRADGSLLEFDSYTEVDGPSFTTIMRPRR